MEKKYLNAQEFADAIGVHVQTVRGWDKEGKLKAHHKTLGGRRLYSISQVDELFNNKHKTKNFKEEKQHGKYC